MHASKPTTRKVKAKRTEDSRLSWGVVGGRKEEEKEVKEEDDDDDDDYDDDDRADSGLDVVLHVSGPNLNWAT